MAVGVDEPMVRRVVVARLQIIEARFGVVVVALQADLSEYSLIKNLIRNKTDYL